MHARGASHWNLRPGAGAAPPSLLLKMAFLEPVRRHATSCFYFLSQRLQVLLGNCRCGIKSPGCARQVAGMERQQRAPRPCCSVLLPSPLSRLPGRPRVRACRSRRLVLAAFSCKPSLPSSALCSSAASPPLQPTVLISPPKHVTVLC